MLDFSFFKTNFNTTIDYANDARDFVKPRTEISTRKTANFDHNNPLHTGLLHNSTEFFNRKRDVLLNLDQHIIGGLAIGIAASVASLILPLSILATGCYIYSIYCLGSRMQAQQEYYAALHNLSDNCVWSLGSATQLEDIPVINNMIAALAPPTTNQQLREFVSPAVGDKMHELADKAENASMLSTFGKALNKDQIGAYQSLYGYDRGSLLDAVKTLYYFANQAFCWAKSKYTAQDPAAAPQQSQDLGDPAVAAATATAR